MVSLGHNELMQKNVTNFLYGAIDIPPLKGKLWSVFYESFKEKRRFDSIWKWNDHAIVRLNWNQSCQSLLCNDHESVYIAVPL